MCEAVGIGEDGEGKDTMSEQVVVEPRHEADLLSRCFILQPPTTAILLPEGPLGQAD